MGRESDFHRFVRDVFQRGISPNWVELLAVGVVLFAILKRAFERHSHDFFCSRLASPEKAGILSEPPKTLPCRPQKLQKTRLKGPASAIKTHATQKRTKQRDKEKTRKKLFKLEATTTKNFKRSREDGEGAPLG